jgi:hypothetical protein
MAEDRSTNADVRDTLSIEREILRALCREDAGAETNRFVRELSGYSWREPEHATVFQAIKSLAARGRRSWREELPAEATRMGFPDVDWRRYFDQDDAAEASGMPLPELMRHLLGTGE